MSFLLLNSCCSIACFFRSCLESGVASNGELPMYKDGKQTEHMGQGDWDRRCGLDACWRMYLTYLLPETSMGGLV